jgi:pimeloyl-ACP methyl ester carboxylesterase
MVQKMTGNVDLGDGKVYIESAGEGEPLVFLHAGFVDSRMWDNQWREFRQENTVIRFDLRGFGRSDRLEKPISRRKELYRVLEAAGVKRATLVGCSLSGETILDAALERPELVSGLIVVSATPSGFEMQGEPPEDLLEMLAAVEQGDMVRASELQLRIWVDGRFRQPEQVDRGVRQLAAEMNQNALEKGIWNLTTTPEPDPLDPPAVQRLGQIKTPVLIIAGEVDDPEILRAASMMAGAIPGAQKFVIPSAAHLPNMEKPTEFNQIFSEFLRRVSGRGASKG